MASEKTLEQTCNDLLPYVHPLMDGRQYEGFASPMNAGEPYLALLWLLSFLRVNRGNTPSDLIVRALNLLDDDDKEEYADLIA